MNSESRGRIGGASIIPSARKSIHAYRSCPSENDIAMGRFGINSPSRQKENGTDEVDNIMSKLASSPLQNRKSPRRTSLGTPKESLIVSTDEDDNTLAKSLPAELPSYSYYREEIDDWPEEYESHVNCSGGIFRNFTEEYSPVSSRLYDSLNESRNTSFDPGSPRIQQRYPNSRVQPTNKLQYLVFLLVVIFAMLYSYYGNVFSTHGRATQTKYDLYRFNSDMKGLGERFKINADSILQVQTGISTIYEREDTGSFVFIYNSESSKFNKMLFNNFMDDIASTAARYLRNDTASVQHIVVDSSDLTMKSHSELVSHYRADVAKTGVMLVRELNSLPSPLAMAFHYYCDEYNPLVKKSAIFFTLNLATCSTTVLKTTHAHIERCLTNKWDSVPEDNIQPLLTRIVSVVVDVTSAF